MLDLVFIWLKEHSLIVLFVAGTIFNVFWLYRMRRQLQMKWYAVLIPFGITYCYRRMQCESLCFSGKR